jgi:6-phospho-3-hexuloisomerase
MKQTLKEIVAEIAQVLDEVSEREVDEFIEAIRGAKKIFVHALGREGLVLKSFAMRLAHLGLDVHVVGDMTTPAIGKGDLLVVSTGPGNTASVLTLAHIGQESGAKVAVITAHPEAEGVQFADLLLKVGGQTMATDEDIKSVQPMGSTHEQAEWILLDYIILRLMALLNETNETMSLRHTNLE